MKDQSIVCFTKALLVLAGISVCSTALAQDAKPCLQPDSHITYTIPLLGSPSDIGKITQVQVQGIRPTNPG